MIIEFNKPLPRPLSAGEGCSTENAFFTTALLPLSCGEGVGG